MRQSWLFVGAALFLGILGTAPVSAQSVDTGLVGGVVDTSGAVIPGATITVTNQATGVANTVVSGLNGAFAIRYLAPGAHIVDVTLQGFRAQRTYSF